MSARRGLLGLAAGALLALSACDGAPSTATDGGTDVPPDEWLPPLDGGPPSDSFTPVDVYFPEDTGALPDVGAPTTDTGPTASPLVAPAGRWTWLSLPETRCGNGTSTGVGVNLAPDSRDVLIFLQGGGACWDGAGCFGVVPSSLYVRTGYGRTEFATDVQRVLLPIQRDNPRNPFRRANLVYVPYCTGDVHSGDRVATYRYLGAEHVMHHVGARNLDAILRHVAATVPDARRVWLAGDSAGGFGSALNLDRVQRALPMARVDVLDDSGPPVQPPAERWRAWREAWNLQLPEGCARCADGIVAITDHLRSRYPESRFALISYSHDAVISTFMGITPLEFHSALTEAARGFSTGWPRARYFFLPGVLHVGLATPPPSLFSWLDQFATDDPAWRSQGP